MRRNYSIFMLVAAGTVLGLMGTDLVLPAIPVLPERLGGTASEAQLVLAAYVAGTCLGLIGCGAISERWPAKRLMVASLAGMAVTSYLCTLPPRSRCLQHCARRRALSPRRPLYSRQRS